MSSESTLRTLCLLAVTATAAVTAGAGEPPADETASAERQAAVKAFESLYGKEFETARRTRSKADDVVLARRLVRAADEPRCDAVMAGVLCEEAADLAVAHPSGFEVAVGALVRVTLRDPARAVPAAQRIADIRQRQFQAGSRAGQATSGPAYLDALRTAAAWQLSADEFGEAADLLKQASSMARVLRSPRAADVAGWVTAVGRAARSETTARRHEKILERRPNDVRIREQLVRTYLLNLDDPASAAEHLEGVEDKALRKYLPAVGKGVEAAPELACLELGDWYRSLIQEAPPEAKPAIACRTAAYYERFIRLHPQADADMARARRDLGIMQTELDRLGGSPIDGRPTYDLLPLVDPDARAVNGRWTRRGSGIEVGVSSECRLVIPVAPEGPYDLEVRFIRHKGISTVAAFLPFDGRQVLLLLSFYDGKYGGIDGVDGKEADKNASTFSPCRITNGQEQYLHIRVDPPGEAGGASAEEAAPQVRFRVTWNGRQVVDCGGPVSQVGGYHGKWRIPSNRCLGLAANNSWVEFRSVRLTMRGGEARLLQ